jgi:hypothetical protein
MGLKVAILTPTYCGRDILEYYFQSVIKHKIDPDMFLFVVKPCQDKQKDSIITIEKYKDILDNIAIVNYKGEYGFIKQILLGLRILRRLNFDIVIFTDDDTYFIDNKYITKYLEHYENRIIGGVAGRVVDAKVQPTGDITLLGQYVPIPPKKLYLWRKPATNEIYQLYFTKGGYLASWGNDTYHVIRGKRIIPSLLGVGANMSIRLKALENLIDRYDLLPNMFVGMRYEQILGYHVVKNKYKVIKDYDIITLHLFRETGETRAPRPSRTGTLTATDEFIYYYLKNLYKSDFSFTYHLISILQRFYNHTLIEPRLSYRKCRLETWIGRIIGHLFGNTLGIWYNLTKNKDYLYHHFVNFDKKLRFLDKCMNSRQSQPSHS